MNIYTVKLTYYRMTFGPKPNFCEFSSTFEASDWLAAVNNCIDYLREKVGIGGLDYQSVHVERSCSGDGRSPSSATFLNGVDDR